MLGHAGLLQVPQRSKCHKQSIDRLPNHRLRRVPIVFRGPRGRAARIARHPFSDLFALFAFFSVKNHPECHSRTPRNDTQPVG